jgi:general secretion pathway protein D
VKPAKRWPIATVLVCVVGLTTWPLAVGPVGAEEEEGFQEAPEQAPTDQAPAAEEPAPVTPPVTAQPPVTPAPQPAPQPAPPPRPPQATLEIIEFQNAPVSAVLEYYARLTKRSIISAPNLAGTINFRSQTNLTLDEAIQALDTVLAINGIGTVPMGDKFLKVVQIATAKQEGIGVLPDGKSLPPADSLVTQILALKFADAAEVVTALQPYLHPYGVLLPLTKSNAILMTETGANINQMMEIVKYVDQPSALRMQTKIYVLMHAKAADVVSRLQSIIQETQQIGARAAAPGAQVPPGVRRPVVRPTVPGAPGAPAAPTAEAAPAEESVVEGKVILTSDDRTNKIFILSRPANFAFFDDIIKELDAKVEPDVIIKVIELEYANSEDAAGLVNSLITGAAPPVRRAATTAPTPGRPATPVPATPAAAVAGAALESGGFLQFAEGVRILPDPRTNSLIVMATKEDMERIVALVHSIDTAVAQVLVEVVIAEVTLGNTLSVGVEAFKRLFQEGQVLQTGGYRTGQPIPPVNLTDLGGMVTNIVGGVTNISAAEIAPALLTGGATYFLTFRNLKLDTVIRLLATTSKFKVLSTPIIQTLHNQEASIIVGESRPVVTATVADVVATSATAVRSAVEFKDIAIELKVTPRINPDGYVTMDIEQKINDVAGNVNVNGVDVPIITKREAKSSVTVRDQSTIVLGGLIRDNKTVSETKVPFLGDIPLLGTVFKGKTADKGRTELIVFIRPTVLRTDAQAMAEARGRSHQLKAGEELELEKRFLPKTSKPATAESADNQSRKSESPESAPADRHAAKVRALQQEGVKQSDTPAEPAETD